MKKIICMFVLGLIMIACGPNKQSKDIGYALPFPADEDIKYYQAESDSGRQIFWTDIKGVSSAFLNDSKYADKHVKIDEIKIVKEAPLNGQVKIEFDDAILELTLVRKNMAMGTKSIWQVVAVDERPWAKSSSKSAK